MRVIYFQPRTEAGRNYRSGDGTEQVWTPWWALLLQGQAQPVPATLIDARIDGDWLGKLHRELSTSSEVVVAVSAMTGHALRDAMIASRAAKDAGALVCWGGPHPTLFPEDVGRLPYVDNVIRGFGAAAFGDYVRRVATGSSMPTVIDSRGELGGVPVTLSRRRSSDSAPFRPILDLVKDWNQYVNVDQAIGDRVINLVTSEGCLRRCTYCSEPTTSKNSWLVYETNDCICAAEQIVAAACASGVKLHDPNFLQDVDRGLRFAGEFVRRVGRAWAATIHPADLLQLHEADLAFLSSTGLRRVLVGLESADQALVIKAGKQFDVTRIPEIATKLSRHDIAGMFTFICGWPGADPAHYQRTVDSAYAIRSIDPRHQAKIHFLEPWPGTPIHRMLQRTHDLPDLTIEEWADVDYYFAHHLGLHDSRWEERIRAANKELSPYVEA